jgi:hypothetical protein
VNHTSARCLVNVEKFKQKVKILSPEGVQDQHRILFGLRVVVKETIHPKNIFHNTQGLIFLSVLCWFVVHCRGQY